MEDSSMMDISFPRALLQERFSSEVEEIQPLSGGFFSQAFAFAADGREYVIRLNESVHAADGFANDAYAWRHFNSPTLPIPRVVATGQAESVWYAISERATGRPLHECSPAERRAALPALLETLEAIMKADVSASRGFGYWDRDGNGPCDSWRKFLASQIENDASGYYQDWHNLYTNSFLDPELYEAVHRRMMQLAERCPGERALVHNDYQFENVIVDGERVTAVIDWGNALYGDPLFDIAWLSWIATHPGWWYDDGLEILEQRFGSAPDYAVRLACCQCFVGLDHLRFYATNGRQDDYDLLREWLLNLLFTSAYLL